MAITKEQRQQMLESAKPLIKWLAENVNPHCRAIVDSDSIELVQGIATGTIKFSKD